MKEKCKYRGTSFFKIISKEEIIVTDGKQQTHTWRGCISCWNNLQKVS